MIVAIEGKITKKEPTFVYVKCASGLTYKLNISLFCAANIEKDTLISLHVTQIIREDMHSMYGFISYDEQRVFETLVKLNGIGPSTALAVCSTLSPSEFSSALSAGNVDAFKRVPGIGPKSAKRILVELSDFALEQNAQLSNPSFIEASQALESLGFKKEKVKSVLNSCSSTDTSTLIKEALKKLG